MAESGNDEVYRARRDARDQFAEAVAGLVERIGVQLSVDSATAAQDGYAPIEAFAEATGKSLVHSARILAAQSKDGNVERVRVGKAYWYRSKR